MKIVLTGGGTGGHFYPLIAVAESVRDLVRERHLIEPRIYYVAPEPYDTQALFENEIEFVRSPAGKIRRYFSLLTPLDIFATLFGLLWSAITLFRIMPDVIISKGGYASVPTVLIGALFGIPIIIHESDSKPGRANLLASGFASRIGIAWESARPYFSAKNQSKIALIGIPLRKSVRYTETEGARELLGLDPSTPTILVMGGSSGSKVVNDILMAALPLLVEKYQIIHQTGEKLYKETEAMAKIVLGQSKNADRYHPTPFLSALAIKQSAGIANIIVSRAGSTSIAEISLWSKPSILIPIPESISHDQKSNAYIYARTGAAVVLEEENLTANLLVSEINRILSNPEVASAMAEKSKAFRNVDAGKFIAEEALAIMLSHE
jgi:UDP-N-acetylglucosamine--N-acetylmuramyl-(pentapeptide) pyrophosphoryl-undecaprenol N-acetylglucosamine transferase